MKNLLKVLLILMVALILGAETNSCSISQEIACSKSRLKQSVLPTGSIQEVNNWTLLSRFDF